MTVEEFFDNYLTSKVNLNKICQGECTGSNSGCDICLVISRYKELIEELKKELKILPTEDEENQPSYFLTGSYRRHTMIRPPKDVDLFIVLDSGEYQDSELQDLITPKVLISKLKSVLEKIFESDHEIVVEKQQHSVTVIFDENFSIDVIPVFETDDKKFYKIPDTEHGENGKYIISNPKIHYEYINKINDSTSINGKKRFKRVVRLLKFVKRRKLNTEPAKIRSFHLELLAAKILGSDKINSYSEGLNNFLSVAANCFEKASISDPANRENKVDDYIDDLTAETKDLIKNELNSLYSISKKALELEKLEKDQDAINEWKKIFPTNGEKKNNIGGPTLFSSPQKPWSIL